jgi:hypothetical protein
VLALAVINVADSPFTGDSHAEVTGLKMFG